MCRAAIFACAAAGVIAVAFTASAGNVPKKPTYSRDVAGILNANCVRCHRPGEIGPMSLRNFEEVRPWAKSIGQYVEEGKMPPWHADPGYGPFKNDRQLTEDEIETIVRWVQTGAAEGDPDDLPEPTKFSSA